MVYHRILNIVPCALQWVLVVIVFYDVCVLTQLCAILWGTRDCSPPVSLSMEFSKQEYWSGLPFPSPGDLPNPGIEPTSLASPALQADS